MKIYDCLVCNKNITVSLTTGEHVFGKLTIVADDFIVIENDKGNTTGIDEHTIPMSAIVQYKQTKH